MSIYLGSMTVWWMIAIFAGLIIMTAQKTSPQDTVVFPIEVLGVAVFYTLLGLWGIVAVWLEQKADTLKDQEATISRSSWHYRLNTSIVSDAEWRLPRTECQYWAYTAQNVLSFVPIVVFFAVVAVSLLTLWRIGGWFLGFVPRMTDLSFSAHMKLFERKTWGDYSHQNIGPVLLLVIWVFGTGFLFWEWAVANITTLAVVVMVILLALWFVLWPSQLLRLLRLALRPPAILAKVTVSPFRGIGVYLLMRAAGVCRPVNYVD